jgi:multicomponent K+:H+ antiporter subunit D
LTALSATLHAHLLWVAVVWPLLLACPCLGIRDSWLRYLAIVPAVALAIWPGQASMALPQLMLGTGLAVGQTRWILAMSVAVWLAAAIVHDERRGATLFLLTLAGNIGAVLATDTVGFFFFSALMGYSFYGLFVDTDDEAARRGGRAYLIFLILADQALFDAMLIAATDTSDLRFHAVRQAMAGANHAQTYVLYALVGFALKAGLWPTHWWLPSGYRSASRPTTMLFAGVPVATALLGAVRWLPLGQFSSYALGTSFLALGAAAAVYGAQRLIRSSDAALIPACSVIVGTGILVAFIGRALAVPTEWERYGHSSQLGIASLGFLAMALTVAVPALWGQGRRAPESTLVIPLIIRRRMLTLPRWSEDSLIRGRSWIRAMQQRTTRRYQRAIARGKNAILTDGWSRAIAIFVLLGLLLAWLSM